MRWFKKKPKPDPLHKYVERKHWDKLKANFQLVEAKKLEAVIASGLKYEGKIEHTGDAVLLFEAFLLMMTPQHSQKKRALADCFCSGSALNGFEEIDRQYLIDLAATSLGAFYKEVSRGDKIFEVANELVNTDGVNPLLLQLFQMKAAISRNLTPQDIALVDWYLANFQNSVNDKSNPHKRVVEALQLLSSNAAEASHLKVILSTLETSAIPLYAEKFTAAPGITLNDVNLIRASLFRFRALIESLINEEEGAPEQPPNYELGRPRKPRPPRPTSISDTQIIGEEWEAKLTGNGAKLEYRKSSHGDGTEVVEISKAEFEALRRGEGRYASLYSQKMREKHFGPQAN